MSNCVSFYNTWSEPNKNERRTKSLGFYSLKGFDSFKQLKVVLQLQTCTMIIPKRKQTKKKTTTKHGSKIVKYRYSNNSFYIKTFVFVFSCCSFSLFLLFTVFLLASLQLAEMLNIWSNFMLFNLINDGLSEKMAFYIKGSITQRDSN